jgi:Ca2+-transporting ATPase
LGDEQPVKVLRRNLSIGSSSKGEGGECQILEIPRREVVVGDVVLVETGDEIPADGLLVEAFDL